ncbi:EXS_family protein [Hexamita inflata]|uniref:EXS family protein n=1 Tax=Hexamita inflata TaxID=28002 RepID=A0AA86VT19_9EUKA|nr:EXS family protein [Hexamita inflata]
MQQDTNPEWNYKQPKFTQLHELVDKIHNYDMQLDNSLIQVKQLSKKFIFQLQKDIRQVDSFFIQQVQILTDQAQNIVQIAEKATKLKLSKQKCVVITFKMQECLNNTQQLQNFALYNFEQFRKLVELHDEAQINQNSTYDAQRWFRDYCSQCKFNQDNNFDQIHEIISHSYSNLFYVQKQKAISAIQKQSVKEYQNLEERKRRAIGLANFIGGLIFVLLLILVNIIVYTQTQEIIEINRTQQLAIRTHLVIALMIYGFGFVIKTFHKLRINYAFIFQIPSGVIQLSYRSLLRMGAIQFVVVIISIICCLLCCIKKNSSINIFGYELLKLIQLLTPTIWLIVPVATLIIIILINLTKNAKKQSIFKYALLIIFKMFTPWRQKVEFPFFFFCNFANSSKKTLRDIFLIITCNKLPDYLQYIIQNIFNMIRALQSYLRFRENNKFYSQGWNMIKYIISLIPSLNIIKAIKQNQTAHKVLIGFKSIECIYKLYWDTFEDWGLFTGGSSAKKFKNVQNKWAYGKYVRRPTQLPLLPIILIQCYDYLARTIWILGNIPQFQYFTQNYWYRVVLQIIEVIRRLLWMILRMDNQQCTNAEAYAATSYIPLAFNEYDKQNYSRMNQQKEETTIMQQLNEFQLSINDNPKILTIAKYIFDNREILTEQQLDSILTQLQEPLQTETTQTSGLTEDFEFIIKQYERRVRTSFERKPRDKSIEVASIQSITQQHKQQQQELQLKVKQNNTENGITI